MSFFSMIGDAVKDVADVAEIVGSGGTDVMAWASIVGDIASTVNDAENGSQQQQHGSSGMMGDLGSFASIASMI